MGSGIGYAGGWVWGTKEKGKAMVKGLENLEKAIFPGVGTYNIPQIQPATSPLPSEWRSFNYASTEKHPKEKGLHFFVDDYQFARCWNQPDRYIPIIQRFAVVCSPDFSTYTDMPMALQIYNHYRKHWLGAYWQSMGMVVIPTISWSPRESFAWCFDGEPMGAVVAISSVGTQNSKERRRLFLEGYEVMMNRLRPQSILFYGQVPEECKCNIVRVRSFSEELREALCNGW